ncbi:MAG: methyltransferase, partial [Actinomycetota bacterium]
MTAPAEPTEPSDRASVGSAVLAVVALPVVVGLVLPLAIVAIDPWRRSTEVPSLAIGVVMALTGVAIVARAVLELVTDGRGTLAPVDPPRRLVTTGLFAHCRNPMYVGVLSVLAGLSMASRSP